MGRYAAGLRTTNAPTSTLPAASIYAPSGNGGFLVEVHVTQTVATEQVVSVNRFTTAGTQGTGQTELEYNPEGPTPTMTVFDSHTSTPPTLAGGDLGRATLPAAFGGAFIFIFGDRGIWIPAGTANGIGILAPSGTGQVLDVEFVWDE
jgi:hypothetical protein